MRASNRRLLDDNPQNQSPRPSSPAHQDPTAAATEVARAQFDSSSMAVTALVLLSALFILGFFSVYARRFFAEDHDEDQPNGGPHRSQLPAYRGRYGFPAAAPGLDPLALRDLPLLTYSGGSGKGQGGCAVCLGEFEDKETVKVIPGCGHAFHPDCIDAWLLRRGSCPLCRSTQLFGREVQLEVRGGGADERTTGEDAAASGQLVTGREVHVEVEVVVEGGGSGQREQELGKKIRLGRSDSWCCRTEQRPACLRRSHSL